MSMLAEPRRFRKRYNLVPRGKALFEDDNRFGTKMLERMGWTKGKGLGAREDGSQEFVRIRYKNDSNGIGYEDRDDQWTEHEKQFNGLLSSLHNSEANSDVEDETTRIGFGFEPTNKVKDNNKVKDKISGESLEEKSKKSKARVHYKKFTKGKDLSQYSEKDLANIFGKKTEETIIFQKFEPIVVEMGQVENCEDDFDDSKKFGITTINTGTSVTDYFKLKMEEIKRKRMQGSDTPKKYDEKFISEDLKKKKEKKRTNMIMVQDQNLHENVPVFEITEKCKKKKQKRKHSETIDPPEESLEENTTKKTKKKKRKLESNVQNEERIIENLEELAVENLEKASMEKSKKRKRNLIIAEHSEKLVNADELEISVKKKNTKISDFNLQTSENTENTKSKTKKQKASMPTVLTDLEIINDSKLKSTTIAEIPENSVSEKSTNYNYIISEYCAEKFRHTDLNRFPGSNLSEVIGYGLEKDMKMEIVHSRNDIENITNLWSNAFNISLTDKYKLYNKCPLKKYAQQVKKAKTAKKKIPKINLKRFKNKSIFKNI